MTARGLATGSRAISPANVSAEPTAERSPNPVLGPKDPAVAAVLAFVMALYADGLPTARTYVTRRLREAGMDVDDVTITSACRWAPYRPEPRRPTRSRP